MPFNGCALIWICRMLCLVLGLPFMGQSQSLKLKHQFSGNLAPKSVVTNGKGLFFAQNMMYEHTITVYNRQGKLVTTLSDSIDLTSHGFDRFKEKVQGAPCEATPTHQGRYLWVSNYAMYGSGFDSISDDECEPNGGFDSSFVYKISTTDFTVKNVVQVGCVPKYLASYRDSLILVSNWCSGNVSVISLLTERVVGIYNLKMYPRGIATHPKTGMAYVAQMGTYEIAKINLRTGVLDSIVVPGRSPRHLCLDTSDNYLYASLNGSGIIAKINLKNDSVEATVTTGRAPRSMTLSQDGNYLYVVNYYSNTFSKVRTSDFKVLETVTSELKPIGICFDDKTHQVWVACYEGYVQVFEDRFYGTDSIYLQQPSDRYALVLGSFKNKENAERTLMQFQKKGVVVEIRNDETKYRVLSCCYPSIEEAKQKQKTQPLFKNSWVLKQE